MNKYTTVTFNEEALQAFAKEPYYTEKDFEQITIERNIDNAMRLYGRIPTDELSTMFNLPVSEIQRLAE
jgi:hypothetical protein